MNPYVRHFARNPRHTDFTRGPKSHSRLASGSQSSPERASHARPRNIKQEYCYITPCTSEKLLDALVAQQLVLSFKKCAHCCPLDITVPAVLSMVKPLTIPHSLIEVIDVANPVASIYRWKQCNCAIGSLPTALP